MGTADPQLTRVTDYLLMSEEIHTGFEDAYDNTKLFRVYLLGGLHKKR